jgi:hypothetical protein
MSVLTGPSCNIPALNTSGLLSLILQGDLSARDQSPIRVSAIKGQTGNLLEFGDENGTLLSAIDVTGAITGVSASPAGAVILAPAASARNVIQPTAVGVIPLTLKAFAGQTAVLLQFQDSTGAAQMSVAANGRDWVLDTATGTKWGTATTQKQSWFNAVPVVQQAGASAAAIAAITDANAKSAVTALQAALSTFGFITSPA